MIVSDTNMIVYLFIEGDYTRQAENVLEKDDHWIVPSLWQHEFRNVLATMISNDRLSLDDAGPIIDEAESRMTENTYSVPSHQVLELCDKSNLSAYDCEYVALALMMDVPLVTSDKKLINSFSQIVQSPQGFLDD